MKSELAIDMNAPITDEQIEQIKGIVDYTECVSGELNIDYLIGDGVETSRFTGKKLTKGIVMKDVEKHLEPKGKDIAIEYER